MIRSLRYIIFILFILVLWKPAEATHLKAGQLTAEQSSSNSLTWTFTLTVYTSKEAVHADSLGLDLIYAEIDFNDGTVETVSRTGFKQLDESTYENTFVFSHTFPAPGNYFVAFYEVNRNKEILNIPNSENIPFYIQSFISISPFTGLNSMPVLTVPPIDEAAVGQIYVHNPGAFDSDGDSLSFKLTHPKQSRNNDVTGYSYPQGVTLDPITGDLVWDRPMKEGLYNIAFLIEEWRNGKRIGYVLRDMQIEVVESENDPPVVTIPSDTCIIAGNMYQDTVFAVDPDEHAVTLTSYGGIYSISNDVEFNLYDTGRADSVAAEFKWLTQCSFVRSEPYQVVFKAEDNPPTDIPLVDLKTLNIRVVAPAPVIDTIFGTANTATVQWEPYNCGTGTTMEIYRRDCDSSSYTISACDDNSFIPPGYVKIGNTNSNTGSFTDTTRINPGSFYCYYLLAKFPEPGKGFSIPSQEACFTPAVDLPVPLEVDVINTDTLNGSIQVTWSKSHPDTSIFPPPYSYIVLRSEGFEGGNFSVIDTLPGLSDTLFTDSGLNTAEKSYSYKVFLSYGLGEVSEETANSSSTFLNVQPGSLRAFISFEYNVPWNTTDQPRKLYRKKGSETEYTFLTDLPANTFTHTDEDLEKGDTACYFVEVQGNYCRPDLPENLISRSQEVCIVPADSTPPCPPTLFIADVNCQLPDRTFNLPFWEPDFSTGCNDDIDHYRLYFAGREDEAVVFLTQRPDTFYVHTDSISLAGCYEVTAVNSLGVESQRSNRVCVDICVDYRLPNLITPNGDNQNDKFVPFPTPRNIKAVDFSVFNRWGSRVFHSPEDVYIRWNGTGENNEPVSNGVYFYHARVTYKRRLRKADDILDLSGWIHVIHTPKDPE